MLFGKRGEVSLEKVDGLPPQSCVGIVESDIQADVGFEKQGTDVSRLPNRFIVIIEEALQNVLDLPMVMIQ